MERWKHLSTWEVVPGADPGQRDSEVSGSRDSPAVVHGHQVGDQDEGVSQHAGKELQEKQGSVGYTPSSPHIGRTTQSFTPGRGAHSCHLHRVTCVLQGHPLACGLIQLIPAW